MISVEQKSVTSALFFYLFNILTDGEGKIYSNNSQMSKVFFCFVFLCVFFPVYLGKLWESSSLRVCLPAAEGQAHVCVTVRTCS